MVTNLPALPKCTPSLIDALHADLVEARFAPESIAEFVGEEAFTAYLQDNLAGLRFFLEEKSSPLGTLIRLFLLHDIVSENSVDEALPTLQTSGLFELGLARKTPEGLESTFNLQPYSSDDIGDAWLISDLNQSQTNENLHAEHVLGISNASKTLVQSVIREPVDSALDLGCGCGIQTLHLLAHSEHVTATDISARALEITQFNLLLNHVDEAAFTLLQGDMFEPVTDQKFDLIVSNPPFVISPAGKGEYSYRETSRQGDEFVQQLAGEIPQYLNEDGIAQFIANWEVPNDKTGESCLESWPIQDCTMRVYLRETLSPLAYATMWAKDAHLFDDAYPHVKKSLSDFATRDITEIAFGYFIIKPSDTKKIVTEDLRANALVQPISHDLAADLNTEIFDPEERYIVASDVTEERFYRPGNEHPSLIHLRQGSGLARTTQVSSEIAAVVGACDGELTVNEICAGLAQVLGTDEFELSESIVPPLAMLYQDGYITLSSE